MPFLRAAAVLAALVGLAACEALTGPEAPIVDYSYHYIGNYGTTLARAEVYCAKEHGKKAELKYQAITSSGYDATFSCK